MGVISNGFFGNFNYVDSFNNKNLSNSVSYYPHEEEGEYYRYQVAYFDNDKMRFKEVKVRKNEADKPKSLLRRIFGWFFKVGY